MHRWLRRITLLLIGAVVVGSLWTTEDLRPLSAQAETSPAAQARAAIERLRERQRVAEPEGEATRQPMPQDPLSMVLTFCTQVGDTAALVAEARQSGMTPATLLQFFRATAQEEAKPLITHVITKTLLLTHASTPTQARDYVTAHCLDDPMFWAGTTGALRY